MNLRRYFQTPPPATAWALTEDAIAVLRRDRKRGDVAAGTTIEPGIVEVGPVGLQSVDRSRLVPALSSLQERVKGVRRASVVLPMAWMRAHLLAFDELPHRRAEIDEVVRWRLKKLLPVRPAELRIDLIPAGVPGGSPRLLCLAGLERAFADLEASFSEAGVEPAVVTSRVFALAAALPEDEERAMVVHLDRKLLTVIMLGGGRMELLRTKSLPQQEDVHRVVETELRMTMVYARERLGVEGDISVLGAVEGGMSSDALDAWLIGEEGVVRRTPSSAPDCRLGEDLDPSLLSPAYALIRGRVA